MYMVTFKDNEVKTHHGLPLYELEDGYVIEKGDELHFIDHLPSKEEIDNLPEYGNAMKSKTDKGIAITVLEDE